MIKDLYQLFIKGPLKILVKILYGLYLIFTLKLLVFLCLISRYRKNKSFDIGLGPDPLVNNVHHKKALIKQGYKAQTFVKHLFYISDEFDVRGDQMFKGPWRRYIVDYYLFALCLWRYRCLYIYFNGGPLYPTPWRKIEPYLLKLAKIKIVVMPYGGDIHEATRDPNLLFKNALAADYPNHRFKRILVSERIDRWTKHADHVIGGLEWVDYLYHWDTLMLAHFSIDLSLWSNPKKTQPQEGPLKILHAPNHRTIKGSKHYIQAVKELQDEGFDIELKILERVSNHEVKAAIEDCDMVADQCIMGWYALFAIEAMALKKPVLCHIRKDLEELYIEAGLIQKGELPLIDTHYSKIKEVLAYYCQHRNELSQIGDQSFEFVKKHHSLEYIGSIFANINQKIGLTCPKENS